MTPTRRTLLTAAPVLLAAPAIARAQGQRRWRCVTSWTRNMPGPGVSARRLAERITQLTGGQISIDVFGAGEIVPALQVFDSVSNGQVEMAHTASLFWGGKLPVAPVFTTLPFGPDPLEHMAWLGQNGHALWDELYAPLGVKPLVGGNTGPSAAGWFRREIKSLDDLKGLRIRSTGLGGELYSALGATAMALPPADTYAALERGVVDAVELLAPANDAPLGFSRIAPYYLFPGFNKPNGASELLIGLRLWTELSKPLQAAIEAACVAEHATALAEAHAANARAIAALEKSGVRIMRLSDLDLDRARQSAALLRKRLSTTSPMAEQIIDDQQAFLAESRRWSTLSRV